MTDTRKLTPAQLLRGLALGNETYAVQAEDRARHYDRRAEEIPVLADHCALQAAVARDQAEDYRRRRDALNAGAEAIETLAGLAQVEGVLLKGAA